MPSDDRSLILWESTPNRSRHGGRHVLHRIRAALDNDGALRELLDGEPEGEALSARSPSYRLAEQVVLFVRRLRTTIGIREATIKHLEGELLLTKPGAVKRLVGRAVAAYLAETRGPWISKPRRS